MLTVLIPTHGRPDLLRRTLLSLSQCELPESYRETVIVENGSRDGAEQLVQSLPNDLRARYLHYQLGNKSAALNFAMQAIADEDLVVLFDDDVRIETKALTVYARASELYAAGSYFGGPFQVDYEEEPLPWLTLPASATGWALPEGVTTVTEPIFYGCNWAAWKSDLQAVGGFDPRFGPGGSSGGTGQETSMMRALLNHGITARYLADAWVWHYVPRERCSAAWSLKRSYQYGISLGMDSLNSDSKRLWGAPQWIYRRVLQERAAAFFALVRRDRVKHYQHLYQYRLHCGILCGARKASRVQ